MQFPIQIDILDFIFKGLLIGIISSARMGRSGYIMHSTYPEQRTLVWLCHRYWCRYQRHYLRTHCGIGYELYNETVTEPYLSAYPADFW